jgi:putative transposase
MRGREPTAIELTSQQRSELERIIRKTTRQQAHVTRAKIVLLAADGDNNSAIATHLGCHRETVRKWRQRWAAAAHRLATVAADGAGPELRHHIRALLSDQPRSGSPGKFTAEQICQIIALACTAPEVYARPVTHWTPAELAQEAQQQGIVERLSARHAGRFLKGRGTQAASSPRLVEQ